MTCIRFVVYLICLFLGNMALAKTPKISSSVRQEKQFVSIKAGENLTLQCFYEDVVDARFYWYRQYLGQKPRLISTFYKYETNAAFHDEFKNNPRFKLDTAKGKNHLKITDLRISDSANYFCASSYLYRLDFAEGTMVSVENPISKMQTLVYQSTSETVLPGGSVTLKCTVQPGSCGEEHSVYWFKNSEESQQGLVYSHGGEDERCRKKTNDSRQSCVYKLPIRNLSSSHAGTYYCAVASCGHVLFGKGTKLDLKDNNLVTYLWSAAFSFTSILSVLLAFSLCVMNKKKRSKSSGSEKGPSTHLIADVKGCHHARKLYYTAFIALPDTPQRKKGPIWSECVYHRVT
ncbi:hypothetical protein AMECASPLE_007097 [Ameca splendens]|uniref:Ig-like domain-containing protein n=1 Tax=Ameca splendens TaxID=208324 RepID=A0ABV0Z8Q1_9TELE